MNSSAPAAAFAKLPPHFVMANAFGEELAARLLAFAIVREIGFADTTVGGKRVVRKTIRSSRRTRDFGTLKPELETAFRTAMPAALTALGLPPFVLSELSMELAAHGDGDFYRRHIDTFVGTERTATDRVLTGVYYFHTQPRPYTGGELRLFSLLPDDRGGTYIDIEPRHDSLLFFPAWVPHEVRPVSCPGGQFAQSRFAINCWYSQQPV